MRGPAAVPCAVPTPNTTRACCQSQGLSVRVFWDPDCRVDREACRLQLRFPQKRAYIFSYLEMRPISFITLSTREPRPRQRPPTQSFFERGMFFRYHMGAERTTAPEAMPEAHHYLQGKAAREYSPLHHCHQAATRPVRDGGWSGAITSAQRVARRSSPAEDLHRSRSTCATRRVSTTATHQAAINLQKSTQPAARQPKLHAPPRFAEVVAALAVMVS